MITKKICKECKQEKKIYHMGLCLECFMTIPNENIQRHHIFSKKIRRELYKKRIRKVYIAWKNGKGIENRICIPINSYVIIDDEIHRLCHPENLHYNLNWAIVKGMYKPKESKEEIKDTEKFDKEDEKK